MWVLPTHGRAGRCQEALDSIIAAGTCSPGVVLIDGADPSYDDLRLPPGWTRWVKPVNEGVCAAFNSVLARWPLQPWYGFISDDSIVMTPGWDAKLLAAAGPFTITNSADGWKAKERIHGAVVFGGDLLRALGWWTPPGLQHSFCDDAWEFIARELSLRRYRPEVLVEHRHNGNGKAPVDDTYVKAYSTFDADKAAFAAWMQADGRAAIERVTVALEALSYPAMAPIGDDYLAILATLHNKLKPTHYLEIGVQSGASFQLSALGAQSFGVDPDLRVHADDNPNVHLYAETSDAFFAHFTGAAPIGGALVDLWGNGADLIFVDGDHTYRQALQDIVNCRSVANARTVIAVHDTMPRDARTSTPTLTEDHWTGDVWKAICILRAVYPTLKIEHIPAPPSGLTLIKGEPLSVWRTPGGALPPIDPDLIAAWAPIGQAFLPRDQRSFWTEKGGPLNVRRVDLSGKSVAIGTPAYDGRVGDTYHKAVLRLLPELTSKNVNMATITVKDDSLVQRARNRIVSIFMAECQATHLLFIDSDMGFDPQSVIRLLAHEKDLVAAAGPRKQSPLSFCLKTIDAEASPDRCPITGCLEVDAVGTGFMLISRACLEQMIAAYPDTKYVDADGSYHHELFEVHRHDGKLWSEDYWFCRRWRDIGGQVWVDPTISLEHTGSFTWSGALAQLN